MSEIVAILSDMFESERISNKGFSETMLCLFENGERRANVKARKLKKQMEGEDE